MELSAHTLAHLFAQLGLGNSPEQIEDFIARNGPLGNGVALHEAAFWTPAQARFLREEILEDADWAEVVDDLNVRLHR